MDCFLLLKLFIALVLFLQSYTYSLAFELSIHSIYHSHIISIYTKLDIIYYFLNLYYNR